MSRLIHNDYVQLRSFLTKTWNENEVLFALVCGAEQWDVHRFFAPTMHFSDAELRAHRVEVTKNDSSLPSRASKLARRMQRFDQSAADLPETTYNRAVMAHSNQRSPASVRVLMRPEPDYKKLAVALLMLARQQLERETPQ